LHMQLANESTILYGLDVSRPPAIRSVSDFFPKGHGMPCPSLLFLFHFFSVVSPPLR